MSTAPAPQVDPFIGIVLLTCVLILTLILFNNILGVK